MSEEANQPDKTPGIFSWNELATRDTDAAAAFYKELFGWDIESMDMGDGKQYHMFKLGERPVAGMFELPPEAGDAPPHWMAYVNVEDVEASAAKAEAAGGTVVRPPMQVGEMGKLAVIQDPTGAIFSFWQSLC